MITVSLSSFAKGSDGDPLSGSASYSGSSKVGVNADVASGQTGHAIAAAFAHAAVVFGYIVASADCTLVAGGETIALTAGVPVTWTAAGGDPFSADVTGFALTTTTKPVNLQAVVLLP